MADGRPSPWTKAASPSSTCSAIANDHAATLCAFDLLELDGADTRSTPIEERKQHRAWARQKHPGISINATYDGDGAVVYKRACALGCEGIVSKRLGSPYCAGRTDQCLKMKSPEAPAARPPRVRDRLGKEMREGGAVRRPSGTPGGRGGKKRPRG
jgi:hypothetical protein